MVHKFGGVRIAVLGIGNEMNGDDAAGILIARALKRRLSSKTHKDQTLPYVHKTGQTFPEVLIIDAGPAPENFSGVLRRFQAQTVFLVDAADIGQPPGSWDWVDREDVQGFGGSTHLFPLSTFADYLIHELGCQVAFIAIQPGQVDYGSQISQPVRRAVRKITNELVSEIFDRPEETAKNL